MRMIKGLCGSLGIRTKIHCEMSVERLEMGIEIKGNVPEQKEAKHTQ